MQGSPLPTVNFTRRAILGTGLLMPAMLVVSSPCLAATSKVAKVMRCADMATTLGVNTHLSYSNSQYESFDTVLSALNYCGIRHVRDAALYGGELNAAYYTRLAAAGIDFCMQFGPGKSIASVMSQVSALESAYPGAVALLEGPNEITRHFAYAGLVGNAAGRQFMVDMRTTASAFLNLSAKPLASFTTYAPATSIADYGNAHPYPKDGAQPGHLLFTRDEQWAGINGAMPGKAMMFTEFGYHTLVGSPAPMQWEGVDEATQAVMLLNGLFDAAVDGVRRTYIYQLLDGQADPVGQPTQENHFGLFRFDGTPKAAATAIRNLLTLIADAGADASNFTPLASSLRMEASGPVNGLPLQNSNGQKSLVLWSENPVWDKLTHWPLPPRPVTVTLNMPNQTRFSAVTIVDGNPLNISQNGTTAILSLGAGPVLVTLA